jgi:hypothetical protein
MNRDRRIGLLGWLAAVAVAAAIGPWAVAARLLWRAWWRRCSPRGAVFVPVFVGLLGGLATLAVARSRQARHADPGPAVAGLGLAGVAACVAFIGYYLAAYPAYHRARLNAANL